MNQQTHVCSSEGNGSDEITPARAGGGCSGKRGSQEPALPGRARSATEIRRRARLTPIMIQAMTWTPLSLTRVWKTIPVMADEAMEPT